MCWLIGHFDLKKSLQAANSRCEKMKSALAIVFQQVDRIFACTDQDKAVRKASRTSSKTVRSANNLLDYWGRNELISLLRMLGMEFEQWHTSKGILAPYIIIIEYNWGLSIQSPWNIQLTIVMHVEIEIAKKFRFRKIAQRGIPCGPLMWPQWKYASLHVQLNKFIMMGDS